MLTRCTIQKYVAQGFVGVYPIRTVFLQIPLLLEKVMAFHCRMILKSVGGLFVIIFNDYLYKVFYQLWNILLIFPIK